MVGDYELECMHYGCKGRKVMTEPMSVGWKVGDIVRTNSEDPDRIRCHLCKRGQMRVTKVPLFRTEVPVKGFARLPKE